MIPQAAVEKYINYESVTGLLSELVGIHSPYFRETGIVDYVYSWLADRHLPVELYSFSEAKITGVSGRNVVGELCGSNGGPKLLINGHLDTVDICEGWTRNPLDAEIADGRLYGLGALDMKGGVAAAMLAIEAFSMIKPEFRGRLQYTFVSGEEGPYGLGTDALINDGIISRADAALVPEPSAAFCGVEFPCLCLGARGGWHYTVKFTGRSAHAAAPEDGLNAVSEASRFICELEKTALPERVPLGRGSICITGISGGGKTCSVAEDASVTVLRHVTLGEDPQLLMKEINAAAQRAGIRCDYEVKFREAPGPGSEGFHPYVVDKNSPESRLLMESILDVTGREADTAYFSSIGDFNYISSRAGIPAYIFGPDGGNYHGPDEYVIIDSVVETAKVILDFIIRFFR